MRIAETIETLGYVPLGNLESREFFKTNAFDRLQKRQCPMCGTNLLDQSQLRLVGEHKQLSHTETWIVFGIKHVTKYEIRACYVPICQACTHTYDKHDWWGLLIWLGFFQFIPVMILAAYLNTYVQPFSTYIYLGSMGLAGIAIIAGFILHSVGASVSDAILQLSPPDWVAGFPPKIDNWEFPTVTTANDLDKLIRNLRHP